MTRTEVTFLTLNALMIAGAFIYYFLTIPELY